MCATIERAEQGRIVYPDASGIAFIIYWVSTQYVVCDYVAPGYLRVCFVGAARPRRIERQDADLPLVPLVLFIRAEVSMGSEPAGALSRAAAWDFPRGTSNSLLPENGP